MRLKAFILPLVFLPFSALAQIEASDTIAVSFPPDSANLINRSDIYYNFDRLYSEVTSGYALTNAFSQDTVIIKEAEIDIAPQPGLARIASWQNGFVYATGGVQTMPGLMAINSGSVNLTHNFGRLTVEAFAVANKYGYFRGLQTSYGFGGALTYRFSDKLSATIFGEYHTPVGIYQPAMAGYVNIPNFGGYIDYSFSDKFGVEVGAQGYQSMLTRRIEAQPILKPYFRVSKHSKIGVDVGGILYHLINNRNSQYTGSRNPTIGPPVQKLSQAMGY